MNDSVKPNNEVGPGEVFDTARGISIVPIVDHMTGPNDGILNHSFDFRTNGGRCIFDVAGTGWRPSVGMIEMTVFVNGAPQVVCQTFTNEGSSHKTLEPRRFVMTNLEPNARHTLRIERGNAASLFDQNDRIDVILTELIGI